MALLDFVMILLAAGALVNAWLMRDGLFESWRDALQVWGGLHGDSQVSPGYLRWFVAKLLNCRTCLTYHASFWLTAIFWLPSLWLPPLWGVVWFVPVYALAATRLSLLIGTLVAYLDIEGDPELD